jgi:DNA polymerase-1
MQRRRLIPKLSQKNVTMIVDGRYLCYRAKYNKQLKLTYHGVETGVIFYFFNTLQSLANKFDVTNTVIMWDISKVGVRKDEFAGYKNREQLLTPEEREEKFKFEEAYINLMAICSNVGFATFDLPMYEADDLIALWCKTYNRGTNIIITRDEDMYQLITNKTFVYDPDAKIKKNAEWFRRTYDIQPDQWADYKAIAGCKSDTVPGIPGMGHKRTLAYLKGDTQWEDRVLNNDALYMLCHNLVVLPHPSLDDYWLPYKETKLDEDEFINFCQAFGMRSFMEKLQNFYIFM